MHGSLRDFGHMNQQKTSTFGPLNVAVLLYPFSSWIFNGEHVKEYLALKLIPRSVSCLLKLGIITCTQGVLTSAYRWANARPLRFQSYAINGQTVNPHPYCSLSVNLCLYETFSKHFTPERYKNKKELCNRVAWFRTFSTHLESFCRRQQLWILMWVLSFFDANINTRSSQTFSIACL